MSRVSELLSPQPLSTDFDHPSPTVVGAYSICRKAEHDINLSQTHLPRDNPTVRVKLINIRILGHLLSQSRFLSDMAISTVARAIVSCRRSAAETDEDDVEELNKLGEFYKNYFLRPCKFTAILT